jgi:hypothetical protein
MYENGKMRHIETVLRRTFYSLKENKMERWMG